MGLKNSDYQTLILAITFVSASILIFFHRKLNQLQNSTKLPPGPHPLSIIGNISQVTHKTLESLWTNHDTILGNIASIIISSPQLVKQVLLENETNKLQELLDYMNGKCYKKCPINSHSLYTVLHIG